MLYHLALYFKQNISWLNVIHYVSFRAMAALLTSLLTSFIFGNYFIEKSKLFFRSAAREYTPEHHKLKNNMPTMGGIFILTVVVVNSLLWCNLLHHEVFIMLACLLGFGGIGLCDDLYKIHKKKGLSASHKLYLQLLVAGIIALLLVLHGADLRLSFPFFKNFNPYLGVLFIPWVMLVLIGCSNAVNLTDGLDGLAISSLIPNFALYSIMCYVAGHYMLATYLHILYAGTSEITIIGTTLVGACLGFLWYNTYPAQIFMGDVGSLGLGAGLALMAVMAKQELLLIVSGGLFVIEALSVIIQVFSFKLLKRRIFKMAPIHHHFELLGWQESKITVRFAIISLILCLLALMTLKMR